MATEQTVSECVLSKSFDESHDAGDLPMKDPETSCESVDTEETPPSELCDDPFAIVEEENTEKLRDISIEENPEVVKSEQSPANAETEEKEREQMEQDEDEEDEEDEEENAAVLAEMEADWQRESTEEKEKNQGMTALLDLIRSKGSKPSKSKKKDGRGSEAMDVPELKLTPFGMDGNLRLKMDGDRMTSVAEAKRKRRKLKKEKERAKKSELLSANQKGLKQKLKLQLHRKREQEIEQHRKETESAQSTHATSTEHISEAEEEEEECETDQAISVPDSRASTVPLGDVCSDSESGDSDGSDPEDMARAALMAKPVTLSKEARAMLDDEAEEEDEDGHGHGAEAARDEHEEEFGIAKDLLADKSENRRLRKLKKEIDDKRVDVHRQMCAKDDEAELQKLKSAFVDGEYAQMKQKQKKGVCGAYVGGGAKDETGTAQATEFQFSARTSTSNALSTDAASFLSEDEEKNEFCVYGADGQLNDVHSIRMKVMEWKRLKEKDAALANDAEEPEEREQRAQRRRRVQRKEFLVRSRTENGEAALCGNGHAAKLLEKARNKKSKASNKKPMLGKAATTAFMGMDMSVGGVGGSSFMKHRNKCVQKAKIAQLCSKTGGGGGGAKVVVFERVKKRKRDENQPADHGIFKKRRMQ